MKNEEKSLIFALAQLVCDWNVKETRTDGRFKKKKKEKAIFVKMKKKKRETHPISSSASHKNPHHRIE
jgi:hypothetical protein